MRFHAGKLAGICAAGLFLAGCGGNDGRIKLQFGNEQLTGVRRDMMAAAIKRFEAANPDLRVEMIEINSGKLLSMSAGGIAPDVFFMNRVELPVYLVKKRLLDITDMVQASTAVALKNFYPYMMEPYLFDGKTFGKGRVYGFPKDFSPDVMLFYNKDHFTEAGIPFPDPKKPYTWDEFVTVCKKLTKFNADGTVKRYGVSIPFPSVFFGKLIFSNGGAFFSDDYRTCVVDTPAAVEGLRAMFDLHRVHKVTPFPIAGGSGSSSGMMMDAGEMFRAGIASMSFFGRWEVANFEELFARLGSQGINWGVAPGPQFGKKRLNVTIGPNGYAISATTKHPKEAFRLLEFLVGYEHQSEMARMGWNIPTRIDVAEGEPFLKNPDHPKGVNESFIIEAKYTVPLQTNPYINLWEFLGALSDELGLLDIKKDLTIEQACRNVARKVNDIIKKNMEAENQ